MSAAAPLSGHEERFLALAAELAESFSFSGTVAQIYALLFIRRQPLALGEIVALLGVSKGNTSVNLRILESWGAVRKAWVPGSRRDHYECIRDLKAIALRRLQDGFSRRLAAAQDRLDTLRSDMEPNGKRSQDDADLRFFRENLDNLQREVASANKALRHLADLFRLGRVLG